MSKTLLYVKPAAGAKVRHEHTGKPLHARGDSWADTPYVRRRLRDGDLELATPERTAAASPAEESDSDTPIEASAAKHVTKTPAARSPKKDRKD